jgi:hypothetical protein
MIPKEVTEALNNLYGTAAPDGDIGAEVSLRCYKIIKAFLETTDRYVKDLEQHVDDLVARGNDE